MDTPMNRGKRGKKKCECCSLNIPQQCNSSIFVPSGHLNAENYIVFNLKRIFSVSSSVFFFGWHANNKTLSKANKEEFRYSRPLREKKKEKYKTKITEKQIQH